MTKFTFDVDDEDLLAAFSASREAYDAATKVPSTDDEYFTHICTGFFKEIALTHAPSVTAAKAAYETAVVANEAKVRVAEPVKVVKAEAPVVEEEVK